MDLELIRAAGNKFQEEYNKIHTACPICGSTAHSSTYVGYLIHISETGEVVNRESYKDENEVVCNNCNWKGITHDLVPAE